jgi:hypothetical protein
MPDRRPDLAPAFESQYTWRYEPSQVGLRELYEKAKREQWNAHDAARLGHAVDPESEIIPAAFNPARGLRPVPRCSRRRQATCATRCSLAALAVPARRAGRADDRVAARRVRAVDRRQVLRRDAGDGRGAPRRGLRALPAREARVEFPINENLRKLLDAILSDERWDLKYLGMQILVEGSRWPRSATCTRSPTTRCSSS